MTLADIEKKTGKEIVMRSCWKCNSAHKYLKKADYLIFCFLCGNLYYKGKLFNLEEIE